MPRLPKTIRVVISWYPDGWLSEFPGLKQVSADKWDRSPTLAAAKRHALMKLHIELQGLGKRSTMADRVVWDVQLRELAGPVDQARDAMVRAEEARRDRDRAVRALTAAGVSYRDVAELVGLSHQRVAQLSSNSRPE